MTEVLEGSSSLEPEPLGEEVQGGVVHAYLRISDHSFSRLSAEAGYFYAAGGAFRE
jgi:hypothetical protein